MTQTFMQKVFERIRPILRKITGHKYSCCDGWARCSRCKYVKGGDTENESIPDWRKEIEEEYEWLHWDIR